MIQCPHHSQGLSGFANVVNANNMGTMKCQVQGNGQRTCDPFRRSIAGNFSYKAFARKPHKDRHAKAMKQG